jgi:transcriptional repressor NrdR
MVVKRNGARQEFDVDKIRRGVELACRKLSVSAEDIDRLVEELTMALQRDFDKEVQASEIGNRVMKALRELNSVAYVRFASIYRNFRDVDEFIEEIRALR